MLNTPEVIVIGVVVFVFVGAKRMPELAKALGQGIREFKKASSDVTEEALRALHAPEPSPSVENQPPAVPEKVVKPDFETAQAEPAVVPHAQSK
jgi:sec-independent protein translocase protein TatA